MSNTHTHKKNDPPFCPVLLLPLSYHGLKTSMAEQISQHIKEHICLQTAAGRPFNQMTMCKQALCTQGGTDFSCKIPWICFQKRYDVLSWYSGHDDPKRAFTRYSLTSNVWHDATVCSHVNKQIWISYRTDNRLCAKSHEKKLQHLPTTQTSFLESAREAYLNTHSIKHYNCEQKWACIRSYVESLRK